MALAVRATLAGLSVLAAAVLVACGGSDGSGPRRLSADERVELERLMATPPFDEGTWGLQVRDVESGESIAALAPTGPRQSASTTKNFSIAATVDALGPDHRFKTPLVATSEPRGGILRGDLVLVASGDVNLGGRRTEDGTLDFRLIDHTNANELPGAELTPQDPLAGLDELAAGVAAAGVKRIDGDVLIDDRLWKARRIGKEVISPIVVNDNTIDLEVTPTRPGEPPKVDWRPRPSGWNLEVRARTAPAGTPSTIEATSGGSGHRIVVRGEIAADSDPILRIFRVTDPAAFARALLIDALRRAGVEVTASASAGNNRAALPPRSEVAELEPLAELTSLPLIETAKLILKTSQNRASNTLPFLLAVDAGKRSYEAGVERIREFAARAGAKPDQARIHDAQGLPNDPSEGLKGNAISPDAHAALLRFVSRQPWGEDFQSGMLVQGEDVPPGAEPVPDDPAAGHAFAKEGIGVVTPPGGDPFLQTVALAGYIDAPNGRKLAYDINVTDTPITDEAGHGLSKSTKAKDPAEFIVGEIAKAMAVEQRIIGLLYESQRD